MKAGWKKLPLAEVCTLFTDGDWIETKDQSPEGIRLIQTGNVGVGEFKDRRDKARFISNETFDRLKCKEIYQGDCLVSRLPDPVGRSCIIPATGERMITAVDCTVLRFDTSSLIPEFFNYYAQSALYLCDVEAHCTGATRNRISRKNLGKVTLPLPPFPEQKRIVAILDEAFAGIATAVANTEKNLANARELFEGYLNSVFSQRGEGWEETRLSDFAISVSTGPFGSLLHKSDYVSDGVPLVNPVNIIGSEIVPDENKLISDKTKERLQAYILRKGDIVIARRGEIGRCAVINEEQDGWVCGTGCFFIRPRPVVNSYFLASMIRSDIYRTELERQSTGATMKNISNKTLSNLIIVLPNKAEQEIVVKKLAELSEQSHSLESIYQRKLTALAELKQSLLQKAFSGELTMGIDTLMEEAVA